MNLHTKPLINIINIISGSFNNYATLRNCTHLFLDDPSVPVRSTSAGVLPCPLGYPSGGGRGGEGRGGVREHEILTNEISHTSSLTSRDYSTKLFCSRSFLLLIGYFFSRRSVEPQPHFIIISDFACCLRFVYVAVSIETRGISQLDDMKHQKDKFSVVNSNIFLG